MWELSRTFVISSTLRYLLWRGERYAHRIRDLSLYPSIHGTHGDVFQLGCIEIRPLSLSGGGALWGRDPVKHAGFIYFALSSTQVEYWRTAILLDFSQFH